MYPQTQDTQMITTQVGAQSADCLSGSELTVKQTQTPLYVLGYIVYLHYRSSVRTVPVQPSAGVLLLSFLSLMSCVA